MSISAAGGAAGLEADALPGRLAMGTFVGGGATTLITMERDAFAYFVTVIDVFSDGSGDGDITLRIGNSHGVFNFWNDTFGSVTEGSRHYRGLAVLLTGDELQIESAGPAGQINVGGFVAPYNAGPFLP